MELPVLSAAALHRLCCVFLLCTCTAADLCVSLPGVSVPHAVHETGTGVFRMIGALFISSALMPKHDAAHVSDQGHHSLVKRNKKTPTTYIYI